MIKKLLAIIFLASTSFAAEYYVATDGNDTTGNGSNSTPWATFSRAFGAMTAGDTLWIKDGTYTQQLSGMPDGTSGAYTSVKAVNNWAVTVKANNALNIGGSYVHVEGIHFDGNDYAETGIVSGADHIKIIRCSFSGTGTTDWNVANFTTAAESDYILLEECFAWGEGRYKFLIYNSSHTVLRQCVARHDFHPSTQCSTFHRYASSWVDFQNCIAIDSGLADGSNGGFTGAFYNDNHDPICQNTGKNLGCIVLNIGAWGGFADNRIWGTRTIENCVLWDMPLGMNQSNYNGGDGLHPAESYINHCTLGVFSGGWAYGRAIWDESSTGTMDVLSVSNTIVMQANVALEKVSHSDYNCLYDNETNYSYTDAGAHDNTNNPGLKYIVRAESGSGNASDGGYIGATVLYRYGIPGTLWGETGYEVLTSTPLWPYPNENVIRQKMSADTSWDTWYINQGTPQEIIMSAGSIQGDRGFCATGKQLNGVSDITLTSYIWEYLGNQIPADIYGAVAPTTTTIKGPLILSGQGVVH